MNSIILIGRLTRDPELDRTASGTAACRIRLAIARRRKEGRDQGAVYIDVVAYGAQATACADHLGKGRQIGISGRLEYREWTGSDGGRRSRHEVVADHVEFLGHTNGPDTEPDAAAPPAAARSNGAGRP
jgi:single-strand DNA-binding protein